MPSAFGLSAVRIDKAVDVIIDQIVDCQLDPGVEELFEGGGSNIDNELIAVARQKPIITFTTTALKTALTNCPLSGLVCDDGETVGLIEFHFRKRIQGGAFAGATSHVILTMNLAFMYITSVRVTHPNAAQATFAVVALYDGANNPLIIAKNQTLPTLTSPGDGLWAAGPAYINGTKYDDDLRDFSYNPNISLGYIEGAGSIWPVNVHVLSRDVQMDYTLGDLDHLDDSAGLGSLGKARSGNTRVFLRKVITAGAREGDGETKHIMFDMPEGRIRVMRAGGTHQGDTSVAINCRATWDGTNDPIGVSVDQAIA